MEEEDRILKEIAKIQGIENLDLGACVNAAVQRLKQKKPPVYSAQVWRHVPRGEYYFVTHGPDLNKHLTCLHDGAIWTSSRQLFGGDEDDFEYVGDFSDVFEMKKKKGNDE